MPKIESFTQPQAAAVEIFEQLTLDEERERHRLELRVERAFFEAGVALRELREQRLYRSTHRTFEEYCYARFGYTRRRPYQLIEAAIVFENLCTNGTQNSETNDLCTIGTQDRAPIVERQVLPTSERQIRDLVNLEPEQQRQVWQQAVTQAEGKVPTGRIVRSVVEQIKHKSVHLASDYCFEGEVFFLQRLVGDEKKYNGCWAIAIEVENRFTVKAAVYNGTLEVKQENMKPIDLQPTQTKIAETYKRITRLQQIGSLDREANYVLEGIAKQSNLTEVGEKLLICLEEHYVSERLSKNQEF
ncbi:MAG: hypothetical protein CLLPBCKN_007264 [Chroococcidiopsis cubana SAG 39.79]|uniref:Uncharacterized protein n=1 Tax=Chroococcidiopsis cubana SAG 39.79 TaxID=388085 RepID=A0AB37URM2_9CYAN|nr:hypothetical protein [Chroococcidiopsis cubana]MDZ4877829.1 hypothetical protein [Chroococcidiopsis cubana SAG 39.79]PSB66261.1 hypothetical protein C7B79_01795 [Chroococcidiopsis cubana CCALA 043]RUT14105.1 hypothetical protein DSM107010_05880 [Chroococcidiopsis cubana SAG 39.79]